MSKWRDFIKERTNALLSDDGGYELSGEYDDTPENTDAPAAPEARPAGAPAGSAQIMVLDHITRSDATRIADYIGSSKMVVLNLAETEESDRQRVLDFISGYMYSEQGKLARINTNTYIAVPGHVDLYGAAETDDTLFSQLVAAFGGADENTSEAPE